jgi:Ca2+-binding RTX toxin-like protein
VGAPPAAPGSLAGSASVAQTGSTTATLSGTPRAGETWTIYQNGTPLVSVNYGDTVNLVVVQTLAQFAAALAFKANALAGFVAVGTSDLNKILIASTGAPLGDITALVTRPGTVGTVNTPSQDAKVLTLTGAPIAGATWSVTFDTSNVATAVVDGDDTTADVALKLAQFINSNFATNYVATASGQQVMIVRQVAGALTINALSITDGSAAAGTASVIFDPTNDSWKLVLAGTPVAGEVWQVVFDGAVGLVTESLTVTEGMSLADIATGLAALIDENAGYSAFTELTSAAAGRTTLVLTNNGEDAAAPVLTVTPFNAVQYMRTVTLSGVPTAGQVWSFSNGTHTASYTVLAADVADVDVDGGAAALGRIAAKLAAFVNNPLDGPVFAGYAATASGARILVTRMAGDFNLTGGATGTYTVTTAARSTVSTLAGAVAAGDIWTVRLVDTATLAVASFSYIAAAGDLLAQIAAGLAAAINAGASPNFLAITEGNDLLVINQAGQSFTTKLDLTPATAMSVSRSFDVTGPVAPGQQWTVTLTSGGVATPLMVTVTTDVVGLMVALKNAIDALPGYKASTTGTSLTISTEGANQGKAFTLSSSSPSGSIVEKAVTTRRELEIFGPIVIGDVWTLAFTANGVTSEATLAVTALNAATFVTDLGTQINLLTGYARLTSGNVIAVTSVGPNFGKNFTVAYSIKRVADQSSAVAAATSVGFARGAPVLGEVWSVTVSGAGGGTFSHTVTAGQTLAQVAAALAQEIVDNSSIKAAARGATIVVLGTVTSFSIAPTSHGEASTSPLDGGSVLLGGAPKVGETVTVAITPALGTPLLYQHTVRQSVPLAEIAAGLAAKINAAGLGFTATVDGDTLVVLNANLPAGSLSFAIAPAPLSTTAGIAGKTVLSAANTRFALAGTSRIGEIWSVTIGTHTYDYVVESKEVIAAKLAAAIHATTDVNGNAVFAATVEGARLVVVRLAGTLSTFTAAVAPRNSLTEQDATVAIVTPSAQPVIGETWRVMIGTTPYIHVVQSVGGVAQSIASIVSALAAKINAGPVNGYTAFTDVNVLVITRADNAAITAPTFAVTPAASIAIDSATPTSRIVSFGASGTPVTGETWYVMLQTASGDVAYGITVGALLNLGAGPGVVDTLAEITSELAKSINANAAAGYRAVADGLQLFIIDPAGRSFSASFEIGRPGGIRGGSAQLAAAPAKVLTMAGSAEIGETWSVALTFGGVTRAYGHLVAAGAQTPAQIAASLAAAINADLSAGFTAVADGGKLIIANREGETFTALGFGTPKLVPAGAVQVADAEDEAGGESVHAVEVNLAVLNGGSLVAGATWLLQLELGGQAYTLEHLITGSDSLASIEAAFAAQINSPAAQAAGSPFAGLHASITAAGTLVVVDLAGRDVSASVALKPVAQAAIDGGSATTTVVDLIGTPEQDEVWRLRVGNLIYSITIGSTPQTLAQLASAFASQLNTDATPGAARYTALVDGTRIIIVDREGGVFDTRIDAGNISRYEGHADIQLEYGLSESDMEDELRELYGFAANDLMVTAVTADGATTYTVSFVRGEAGVDFQQIQPVGEASAGLLPSPNASVALSTGTIRNGALINNGVNQLQTVTINPNVTGGSFTVWFRIQNASGEFDMFETAPIAYNASALEFYKALSPILNPNGSTIDIDPEFDRVTRDPSKPYTDNFAVQKVGNVFIVTMQGAHRDLRIHDVDTRNLTTQASGPTAEHEAPVTEVTLGETDGEAAVDATAPRATTVDLVSKTIAAGQVWSVDITLRGISTTHSYTVLAADVAGTQAAAQAKVAQMLAASINSSAADVFTATSDGAVLVVANRDGSSFATGLRLGAANAGGVQVIDRSTPTEAMVNLDGKPAVGEIWQIALSDGITTTPYRYTVLAGDTLEDIAAGLASEVDGAAAYVAVAEADSIVIVRRDGTSFSAAPTVLPAGQPVAGDDFTVTLQSATSGLLTFSYTAVANDTQTSVAYALALLINANGLPEFRATSDGEVLRIESIAGNVFTTTFASNGVARPNDVEAAAATVSTRVEGINYYEIETLNLTLGSGDDVFNVQGTTATTNLDLGAGDDALYVSSAAAVGLGAPEDFLLGHLHNVNGALNIEMGSGANQLMISGEASTLDNDDIVITDQINTGAGEPASSEIAIRGLTGGDAAFGWVDLAQGTITYQAANGNFGNGISIWTGFGEDTIWIDGTADRAGVRTVTSLNTGLGDDTVGVDLDAGEDGLLVLNTQGPWNDYPQSSYPAITDNDTVLGSGTNPANGPGGAYESTLALVVFGGQGDDIITGGSGDDLLFGDRGQLVSFEYVNGIRTDNIVEVLGGGGPGDFTDGVVRNIDQANSTFLLVGGNDTIRGLEGDNLVVGGAGADTITVGAGEDVVLGDNGQFEYTTSTPQGDVVAYVAGSVEITVKTADLDALLAQFGMTLAELIGATFEISVATNGTALGQDREIISIAYGAGTTVLTLDAAFDLGTGAAADLLDYQISVSILTAAQTTDAAAPTDTVQPTWGDTIVTGGGDNVVLAGMGSDHVNDPLAPNSLGVLPSAGNDIVVGDNGQFTWDSNGVPASFGSTNGGQNEYTPGTGASNPLDGTSGGTQSAPAFADMDGDGDLDVVMGVSDGTLRFFENTGTNEVPTYLERFGAANPFDGIDVGDQSTPSFVDLDADGDLDLAVGAADGTLSYFQNTGTSGAPDYVQLAGAANPFNGIDVGDLAAPTFGDLDGDGDVDLVVGAADGTLSYFKNQGTDAAPAYVEIIGAADPFNGIDVGDQSTPSLVDLDSDGDLDLVVGQAGGTLGYYRNVDAGAGPIYDPAAIGAGNPFNGIDVGNQSAPAFADLDGDGDLDLAIGESDGTVSSFENAGTDLAPAYVANAGTANPFDGVDVGLPPSFADLDGDGDLDVVMGASDGTLRYFENQGTAAAPVYVELTGALNPFDGIDVGQLSTPSFTDLDGDGDLDLAVGSSDGTLSYFENTGTTQAPAYVAQTGAANPLGGVDVGLLSAPSFADLDGDGDLDLVVGAADGTLSYYENIGSDAAPAYLERIGVANPLDGVNVGAQSAPSFTDVDGDGDLDLVVGAADGTLRYYENTGTGATPVYVERSGAANPFAGVDAGVLSKPAFADLDGDGDEELVVAESDGALLFFENTSTGAGGDDVIVVGDGNNIVVGGFGNDQIAAGNDDDVLLGDNGAVIYTPGTPDVLRALSSGVVDGSGGDDTISAGDGDNIVLAGVGTDMVTAGSGADIVIGDNGQINWMPTGELSQVMTTDPALGAGDDIQAGDGNNIMAGGVGIDLLVGGADEDLILGDNGLFDFTTNNFGVAILTEARTADTVNQPLWGDTIVTGGGDNVVLAGVGSDHVNDPLAPASPGVLPSAGTDIVVGDNGQVTWGIDEQVESFVSTQPDFGGDDVIAVGDGENIVVGGFGADNIATGNNADIVLGDSGQIDWMPTGELSQVITTGPALGGDDNIQAGNGDNIVAGGVGADLIVGGADEDLILGDNGQFGYTTSTATGNVVSYVAGAVQITIETADLNALLAQLGMATPAGLVGSMFEISLATNGTALGQGREITSAAAGAVPGTTVLTLDAAFDLGTGLASHLLNYLVSVDVLTLAQTTDVVDQQTWGDTIVTGGGDNVVLAGVGSDHVNDPATSPTAVPSTGTDIVIGDNGQVTWGVDEQLESFVSTQPDFGGDDVIAVGAGDNMVVGGLGTDTVSTGNGADIVIGDSGVINWDTNGLLTDFASSAPTLGGNDQIDVGDGENIVVGGFGGDTITTGIDNDIVLGDNGAVTYTPGTTQLLQAVSTDTTNATGGDDIITAGDGDNLIVAGVGNDTVTAGIGNDLVLGDNGQIDWMPTGEYDSFQTTDPTLGGNDDIRVGDGDNIVAGGFGADVIETGVGEDLILGDNGLFDFTTDALGNAILTEAITTDTDPSTGAGDVIVSGGGTTNNIVLAGLGDDLVNVQGPAPTDPAPAVSSGQDIVIGDNGVVHWDTDALITDFASTDPSLGGNDQIDVGDGQNIVVGGFGDDTITTGMGADIVLGDDGQVDYVGTDGNSADIDVIESTSTTAFGGADTIVTSGGDDIVIGGRADDTIDAGDGDNLVIGDSGRITAEDIDAPQMAGQPITLGLVESIQLDDGGDDVITAGTGTDIVLGGFGGDTIDSGDGDDTVFGDNGLIDYTDAVPTLIVTTDTVAETGGDDTIDAGDGDNVVFGGVGSDTVTTGSGTDIVVGDNGAVVNDNTGEIVEVTTGAPALGGDDVIETGDGDDVAMGGALDDTVTSEGGNDILFGDGGSVTFSAGGTNVLIASIDTTIGGNDTLDGGAGNDILVGGQGDDLLFGTLDDDLLFGGNVAVTLEGGIVTSIETDTHDLVSESMFGGFNALKKKLADGESLPFDLNEVIAQLEAAIAQTLAQLDAEMFRRLLDLSADGNSVGEQYLFVLLNLFNEISVTAPIPPSHADGGQEQGGNQQGGGDASAPSGAALDMADETKLALILDQFADGEPEGREAAALAAALGAAGLVAVQRPQAARPRTSAVRLKNSDKRAVGLTLSE